MSSRAAPSHKILVVGSFFAALCFATLTRTWEWPQLRLAWGVTARPAERSGSGDVDLYVEVALENGSVVLPSGVEVVDARLRDGGGGGAFISVKHEVQEQYASGNTSVYALSELYDHPELFRMKFLEVTYKMASAPTSVPSPQRPPGVTVLVQIGNANASSWADLNRCMLSVSQAMENEGHGFSVFFAFQDKIFRRDIDRIERVAKRAFGSGAVRSMRVENKGADIGPFLRQLQVLSGEIPRAVEILNVPEDPQQERDSRPQAVKGPEVFDTFLKLHTKSDGRKRRSWLKDLCGDVLTAQTIYNEFKQSESLGMVGARDCVFSDHRKTRAYRFYPVFGQDDVCAMKRTWKIMQPHVPFEIPLISARIIAGSFYWARPDAVLYQIILRSAENLIMSMPYGYRTNATAQTSHALERLIPTMAVAVRGLDVLPVIKLSGRGRLLRPSEMEAERKRQIVQSRSIQRELNHLAGKCEDKQPAQ